MKVPKHKLWTCLSLVFNDFSSFVNGLHSIFQKSMCPPRFLYLWFLHSSLYPTALLQISHFRTPSHLSWFLAELRLSLSLPDGCSIVPTFLFVFILTNWSFTRLLRKFSKHLCVHVFISFLQTVWSDWALKYEWEHDFRSKKTEPKTPNHLLALPPDTEHEFHPSSLHSISLPFSCLSLSPSLPRILKNFLILTYYHLESDNHKIINKIYFYWALSYLSLDIPRDTYKPAAFQQNVMFWNLTNLLLLGRKKKQ